MVALPANPAKLVAAVARRASIGDFSDKLSFRDRFGEQFSEVCQALRTRTSPGVVILIDDLDRCQPEDTLKILEAVNYFVSAGPCIVILGMDRRQVEYCVGLGFEKLVEGLPDDELVYEDELLQDSDGRVQKVAKQRAFARHYLEKLVNVEVPVPELTEQQLNAMLVPSEPERRDTPGEDHVGWWRHLVALLWGRVDRPAGVGKETNETRAPTTEPPSWLYGFKFGVSTAAQFARVGVLAFVLGWLVVWGAEDVREWPAKEVKPSPAASSPGEPSAKSSTSCRKTRRLPLALNWHQTSPESLSRKSVPSAISPPGGAGSGGRRPYLVLLVAALWGVGAFMHRERRVVDDSPDFMKALAAVRPLLEEVNPTPRAIKRYQNRMRYLAERLRPQDYEPDAIDSFLHWLGARLRRSIVPDAWFEDTLRTAISEPALFCWVRSRLLHRGRSIRAPKRSSTGSTGKQTATRGRSDGRIFGARSRRISGRGFLKPSIPAHGRVRRTFGFIRASCKEVGAGTSLAARLPPRPAAVHPGRGRSSSLTTRAKARCIAWNWRTRPATAALHDDKMAACRWMRRDASMRHFCGRNQRFCGQMTTMTKK